MNFKSNSHLTLTILLLLGHISHTLSEIYQLIRKDENYQEYEIRTSNNGLKKLTMKEFYDCTYNLDYIFIPQNFSDGVEKWITFIDDYCSNNFITFEQFRVSYYTNYLRKAQENFDKCLDFADSKLGNGSPKLFKICTELRGVPYTGDTKIKPKLIQCMSTILPKSNQSVSTRYAEIIEKKMSSCLKIAFNGRQESAFQNCLAEFKTNAIEIKKRFTNFNGQTSEIYSTLFIEYDVLKLLEPYYQNGVGDKVSNENQIKLEIPFIAHLISSDVFFTYYFHKYQAPDWDFESQNAKLHCVSKFQSSNSEKYSDYFSQKQDYQKFKAKQFFSKVGNPTAQENLAVLLNEADNIDQDLYKVFILTCVMVANYKNPMSQTELETLIDNLFEVKINKEDTYQMYLIKAKSQTTYIPLTQSLWLNEQKSISLN